MEKYGIRRKNIAAVHTSIKSKSCRYSVTAAVRTGYGHHAYLYFTWLMCTVQILFRSLLHAYKGLNWYRSYRKIAEIDCQIT